MVFPRKPRRHKGAKSGNPKTKIDHIEDQIQATIVQYHAAVVPPGSAILFAVPNGEYRDPATAVKLAGRALDELAPDDAFLVPHGQGVLHGTVDLVLLTDGGVTDLIEVKRPKSEKNAFHEKKDAGRLSRSQKIFRDAAVNLKHNHWVIYSVEEYDRILRLRKVPVRAVLFPEAFGVARRI